MTKEILTTAIENIGDKYISEFADIQPPKKRSFVFFKIASVAACLAIIAVGSVALINNSGSPAPELPQVVADPSGSEESNEQKLINSASSDSSELPDAVSDPYLDAPSVGSEIDKPSIPIIGGTTELEYCLGGSPQKGKILIDPVIGSIVDLYPPETLFALMLMEFEKVDYEPGIYSYEPTDDNKAAIYNQFVKPLNIKEDYMELSMIFLTKEQIYSLAASDDFALFITIAPFPRIEVAERNLNRLPDDKPMEIYIELYEPNEKFKETFNLSDEEVLGRGVSFEVYVLKISKEKAMEIMDNKAIKRMVYCPKADELDWELLCPALNY